MELSVISELSLKEFIQILNINLKSEDYFVFENNIVNNRRYPMHIPLHIPHKAVDFYCIFIITQGKCIYSKYDQQYELNTGDIVFCPISEPFIIDYISDDYSGKYIYFSIDIFSQNYLKFSSYTTLNGLIGKNPLPIRNNKKLVQKIMYHLDALEELNNPKNSYEFSEEMIKHHFSLLIYEFDQHSQISSLRENISRREEEITQQFFELVKSHFKIHHDVLFYAEKLFLSRKYLTKTITKTTGQSPRTIINKAIISEAKTLLRTGFSNIELLSREFHFADLASFSKFFKKNTGCSPSYFKNCTHEVENCPYSC